MLISNFGIILSRLSIEDIELVRYWRNSKEISQFMEYQYFITEAQQKKWFYSLDVISDFYFIINWQGQKIGLIHTSAVDWKLKTAHAGLFIWDRNYLGTHIPVLASLAMLECFFGKLGLEKYYAKVGEENTVAIRYNKALGFTLSAKSKDDSKFDFYTLDKSVYYKVADKFKKVASRVSGAAENIEVEKEILSEIEKINS